MEAIIFDLDGTLWDSTGCVYKIWNNVFERIGEVNLRVDQKKVHDLMGYTMEQIGQKLFLNLTPEERMRIVEEIGKEEVVYLKENGAILYDGVEEVLKILVKDYKLYIVSNCQDGYVQAFLHAHKLKQYFEDIEMSGRTRKEKGENIKLLMERNHVHSAVYVGDTDTDKQAAHKAKIPFIWASYGFGKVDAEYKIDHFSQLPFLMEKI